MPAARRGKDTLTPSAAFFKEVSAPQSLTRKIILLSYDVFCDVSTILMKYCKTQSSDLLYFLENKSLKIIVVVRRLTPGVAHFWLSVVEQRKETFDGGATLLRRNVKDESQTIGYRIVQLGESQCKFLFQCNFTSSL